jgi:hypothetical protein
MPERTEDSSFSEFRLHLRRPRLLILFAWFLIVTGAVTPFALIHIDEFPALFPLGQSRFPDEVHHLVMAAGGALRVACGIGLLSGFEWARFLWLLVSFASAGFAFFAFPPSARILIPSLLLPALSLFVLFRPAVNDYFIAISSGNFPDQH